MSDKVKPWHQRKPKHQDKNPRPKNRKKDDYCPPMDGDDIDGEDGSMLGANYPEDWKS